MPIAAHIARLVEYRKYCAMDGHVDHRCMVCIGPVGVLASQPRMRVGAVCGRHRYEGAAAVHDSTLYRKAAAD